MTDEQQLVKCCVYQLNNCSICYDIVPCQGSHTLMLDTSDERTTGSCELISEPSNTMQSQFGQPTSLTQ